MQTPSAPAGSASAASSALTGERRQQSQHGVGFPHVFDEIRAAETEEAAWADEVQERLHFFEDLFLLAHVSATGFTGLRTSNPIMDQKAEAAYRAYLADYCVPPAKIPVTFLIVSGRPVSCTSYLISQLNIMCKAINLACDLHCSVCKIKGNNALISNISKHFCRKTLNVSNK